MSQNFADAALSRPDRCYFYYYLSPFQAEYGNKRRRAIGDTYTYIPGYYWRDMDTGVEYRVTKEQTEGHPVLYAHLDRRISDWDAIPQQGRDRHAGRQCRLVGPCTPRTPRSEPTSSATARTRASAPPSRARSTSSTSARPSPSRRTASRHLPAATSTRRGGAWTPRDGCWTASDGATAEQATARAPDPPLPRHHRRLRRTHR